MKHATLTDRVDDVPREQEIPVASDTGIPIKNIWFMLLYAWDQPDFVGRWQADVEAAPTLASLLAAILANLVQQRLRIGLARGYVDHQDEVPGVKGRIVFSETLRRLSLQHGRTICRYSLFTPDVLPNRVIRFTLHVIFERFVARFYQQHLGEWEVKPQKRISWPAETPLALLPSMQPDIVLQHRGTNRVVVVDTKFTPRILKRSQHGGERFASSHLYQMCSYLRTQEEVSPFHAVATGILLYPTARYEVSEAVVMQGHRMRWETVDLSVEWSLIAEKLRQVMATESATAAWSQHGACPNNDVLR